MTSTSLKLPYPEESLDRFSVPPISYTDTRERDIKIRINNNDFEALVEMYQEVTADKTSTRFPPVSHGYNSWLTSVLSRGYSVVAWHADRAVGHAMLVPDTATEYELAVSVRDGYRRAGIGTVLVQAVFGLGQQHGVKRVWFLVDRWNRAAMALFQPYRDTAGRKLVGTEYTFAIRL